MIKCTNSSSIIDLTNEKRSIKFWKHRQMVQESNSQKLPEVDHASEEHPNKRRASRESIHPNPENRLTHVIEYLQRETEVHKTLTKNLTEEVEKRSPIHEAVVSYIQKRVKSIGAKRRDRSHVLELMQRGKTSVDVIIEVTRLDG